MLTITIPGKPLSRRIMIGKYGKPYNATAKQERVIQIIIKNEARKHGFRRCDQVRLPVKFRFFINKSEPGRPPDPSNLPKVFCDCLTRARIIKDDSEKYLLLIYDEAKDYIRQPGIESQTEIIIYD
jgi:Holliday junction resolvase RusA-like endonuclease